MEFDCISVIPEVFDSYIHASILGRALDAISFRSMPTICAIGPMTDTARSTMPPLGASRAC